MESDPEEFSRKKSAAGRKRSAHGDIMYKQLEQYKGRPRSFAGDGNFTSDEGTRLETTRARLSVVLKKHEDLKERVSRDTDKMIFDRLQKEFEVARASQTEEMFLEGEQWNDGLLATIRERVHMEADRKAMPSQDSMPSDPHFVGKITYRTGNKVICCLEGTRIGIQYETYFAGEPCEIYHCILESKSFLEKMTVAEHTIPFFLPMREVENDYLSSNAIKFIDYIGDILQAYVDRREQVRVLKEVYGHRIKDLFCSLSCDLIEFVVENTSCRVTFSLRYGDLNCTLPSKIRVLMWPVNSSPRMSPVSTNDDGATTSAVTPGPTRLPDAEEALRAESLPEAFAEIILNLPQAEQLPLTVPLAT